MQRASAELRLCSQPCCRHRSQGFVWLPGNLSAWKSHSFTSAPGKFGGRCICEVQSLTLRQMVLSCAARKSTSKESGVTVHGEMSGTKTVPQLCPSPFSAWLVSLSFLIPPNQRWPT